MRKTGMILLVLWTLSVSSWALDGFPVNELHGRVLLGRYLGLLEDTSGQLDFSAIRSGQYEFKPGNMDMPSWGFTSSAIWVRLALIFPNKPMDDLVLAVDYPHLDYIDLYAPDSNGNYQKTSTGYARPFNSRPVRHSQFLFYLHPQPGKTCVYYLRFQNTDRMEIPLWLWERRQFLEADQPLRLFNGMFLGLVCSAILLNLLLFLTFRDISYLHYTGFLTFFSLFVATHAGVVYEYLWPKFLEPWNHYIRFAIGGLLYFLILLAQSYLSTAKRFPRCHRFLVGLEWVQAATILLVVFLPVRTGTMLQVIMTSLTMGSVFTVSALTAPSSRIARYFFVAWVIALLTGVFYSLKALGFMELAWFEVDILAVVWVIQYIILSLGLAERLVQTRQEKENLQKEAIASLEKADRLKDEFLANTSHELRTPLNGIIGIAESLLDGAAGPLRPDSRDNLNAVVSSGRRLANLVNDILDISKLRNGEILLKENAVDLRQVAELVKAILQPLAQRKSLQLENQIPPNLPFAKADEDRLQQIFHNLIGNAIKFTEKGKITIFAETRDDELEVCIQDTGPGIPSEKREMIFQAFQQGDASGTRSHGGTGLGLNLCQQLVHLHGGRIWVKSEEGQGSQFFFTLPRARSGIPSVPLEQQQGTPVTTILPIGTYAVESFKSEGGNGEVRILAVDDESLNLKVLVNQLTSSNYQVITATNGQEALDILERQSMPDLVLLDVMMPRLSGYEVCRRI
ncbi:MAG TPA: 7TM-DISM domain-containing protein, partial [Fibrobacteraceae bacterium]|nr:7TM-DISM domain-containing protein [Fibrobacteraceae bacterium]